MSDSRLEKLSILHGAITPYHYCNCNQSTFGNTISYFWYCTLYFCSIVKASEIKCYDWTIVAWSLTFLLCLSVIKLLQCCWSLLLNLGAEIFCWEWGDEHERPHFVTCFGHFYLCMIVKRKVSKYIFARSARTFDSQTFWTWFGVPYKNLYRSFAPAF